MGFIYGIFSHRTVNSLGSGNSKDDNKTNKNFVDMPDVKIALDKEEGREEEADDQPDPDAIDETVSHEIFRLTPLMKW